MSAVTAWILTILGVVIVGVLVDLLLPSGRMSKFIKSTFAAITVVIIILPLPNIIKNGFGSKEFPFGSDVVIQENYVQYIERLKKDTLIKGLKAALQDDGIKLGEISIDGDFSGSVPTVRTVSINLSQVVIIGQSEHINKCELVRSKISDYLSIDKDAITVYES